MLVIRRDQVERLARAPRRAFVERTRAHYAQLHPEWVEKLGLEGAAEYIDRMIDRAAAHRIKTVYSVAVLVGLCIEFGDDFEHCENRDWALTILTHETVPEDHKIKVLIERMRRKPQAPPDPTSDPR
jgi:hypothetical protein